MSSLFLSPVALAYSRYQEHEADRYALDLTHANHSAAMADVKMQSENLCNPRPGLFYTIFRASHPSIADRIEFSNTYHPWRSDSTPGPMPSPLASATGPNRTGINRRGCRMVCPRPRGRTSSARPMSPGGMRPGSVARVRR